MYLFYFGESGDSGFVNSPSRLFVLACLVVKSDERLAVLDEIIRFRKDIEREYGIDMRAELKATGMIHRRGFWRKTRLRREDRLRIYSRSLQLITDLKSARPYDIGVFSIIIDKRILPQNYDPRDLAWTLALQRVDSFPKDKNNLGIIFPGKRYPDDIKSKLRTARRHSLVPSASGTEPLQKELKYVAEDQATQDSGEDYFLQSADLLAYASSRYVDPVAWFGMEYWDILGNARLEQINKVRNGPAGIITYPK
jgi:hypothetical protein